MTPHDRLALLFHIVATPALAVRDAVRGIRLYGQGVAEADGRSRARQFLDQLRLRLRHGTTTGSYYRFQLYRRDRERQAPAFVQARELRTLSRALRVAYAPAADILRDKQLFDEWGRANRLPTATTIAVFARGQLAPPGLVLPPRDLFSKPVQTYGGRGATLWRWVDGAFVGPDGIRRSSEGLVEQLTATAHASGTVLQVRLYNHPDVADLSDGGLCTVRVMTLRDGQEEPRALLAVYRMPVGDSPADNFDRGGLAASVTLATGQLGSAVRKDPRVLISEVDVHPTTGARIAGRTLPLWDAVVALGLRAHAALPPYPVVGWDVALTDHGPLLLEGNYNPCNALAQMPSGVPLCATQYVTVVLDSLHA